MLVRTWGQLGAILGGVFAQRGHSANYYVVCPENTPEAHPPTEGCRINSKPHQGCRIQDPGTVATGGGKQQAGDLRGFRVLLAPGPPLA